MKFLLFVIAVLMTPCFGVYAQNGQSLRFGVIAPLSGDFAYQGEYLRNGVELAVQQLRKEGHVVEVFYEDACFPKESIAAAHRLIRKKVDALVGSYCIIGMVPIAPLLERNHILTFQSSVVPDKLLNAGHYVLSTNVAIEDEARASARFAREELASERAAVLYFPSDWGENYNRYFVSEYEQQGGTVVDSVLTQVSQMDFRTELTRIKALDIDTLYIAHISSALGAIVKQASELGLQVHLLSTNEAEDPNFLSAAGPASEGMYILTPEPETVSSAVATFRSDYRKQFGATPSVTSANAHDATLIAAELAIQCGKDKLCMKQKAYEVEGFQGGSGIISIQSDGRTVRKFIKKVVQGGRFSRVPSKG